MDEIFDVVVVGGGSGGSVVAGRLSEDPACSVCVVEAGGRGDGPLVTTPVGAALLLPTRFGNWAFETVPQPGLGGRCGYQPRGKALGGSSSINAMVYIRGHRWDYDHWRDLGNPGWSYDELLPYFIRSENNARLGGPFHGQSGPLHVGDLRTDSPYHAPFLGAITEAGFRHNDDFNGPEQEGLGLYQLTQVNGERCSAARAYLLPHLGRRPNLVAHTGSLVRRIVFEGRRAVGVEVWRDGRVSTLRARREVVLAAGGLQSPQLLMLSGVGNGDALSRLGIETVHHLPGVGENLQDHPDFTFAFRATRRDSFGLSPGGAWQLLREGLRFRRERRGMLCSNFAEGGGFLKSRPGLEAPDFQLHFVVALVEDHARKLRLGHGLSCHVCLLRPRSRGWVRLRDADVRSAPVIDPAFFRDPQDLEDMVAGFKLTRRLLQAPSLAACLGEDLRTAQVHSDDEIRDVLRCHVDSVYHPVGTCRMGPDSKAVVDAELRVHGLEHLRIADASVMPTLIGGNTNAPTIMLAEKAVDLILGRRPPVSPPAAPVGLVETAEAALA